jgi:perosamine synthetase
MPALVFEPQTCITRKKLQAAFAEENVDARVFFWPLSSLPMFNSQEINKKSWDIPERAINLPSYHEMTLDEINRVATVVQNIM